MYLVGVLKSTKIYQTCIPRTSVLVSFHMKAEVIRAREGAIADLTFEWFVSCVFSEMSRQLVRASEPPRASLP